MTNFTNNFDLNKAHHDSFFKKASENDIEKGGEGSRGGKIIGHTESGKPIYENHDHPAHKNFTSNDHTDAVYAHVNLTSRKSLATKEEKKKHLEEGKKHGASSHTAKQDPDSLDEYKQEEDKAKKNSEGTKSLHKFSVSAQLKQQGGGSYVKHEVQARDEEHALDQVGEMYQPHGNTQFVRGNSKATKVEKSIDSDSLQKAFEVLGLPDAYDQIEKGGKPALVGEIRDFGGKKMIKTKMGSNSWRPYSPGGKHEHLTSSDKKELVKEETKTESKVEPRQEVENKQPKEEKKIDTQPAKEKEVEGKEKHGYENYDFKEHATRHIKAQTIREEEMKRLGIKWTMDLSPDSRDYVGDAKVKEINDAIAKQLKPLEHLSTTTSKIFGTKNFTIDTQKVQIMSDSDKGNIEKYLAGLHSHTHGDADNITRRTKEAYDFLTQPSVKKEIKKMDSFCESNGLKMRVDYDKVDSSNGKSGLVEITFHSKDWKDDSAPGFKVTASVDRQGNIDFPQLNNLIEGYKPNSDSNRKSVNDYKMMSKFSSNFNPDHKDATGKIDEKWIDLKSKFDNYYSGRDGYSQVTKVDDNTIHFTAGDAGKKKQTHDTVRDAARLSPPSSIGDYKLVASDKVVDHKGNLVDKKDVISNMLKRDNEYSEYENNVDFTYVYKKK